MKRALSALLLVLICSLMLVGCNNAEPEFEQPPVGTEIGATFESVSMKRLDGTSVSPDDYRGKIVIVNVWATWCPPCKAELPDFNKIATEYKNDVVIIAAHTPSGSENAAGYVESNFPKTDIIFGYDTESSDVYRAAGGVGYVPQTAIIDKHGVIIYSDSGILSHEQLVKIIEEQLSK